MIKPKTKKIKKESEFNCYKCFKIMILNLWSEDQERPVKIYGGGLRECSGNIHQHCIIFSINSLCFVSTFSLREIISNSILWSGDRLIDPPDHFKGRSNPARHRLSTARPPFNIGLNISSLEKPHAIGSNWLPTSIFTGLILRSSLNLNSRNTIGANAVILYPVTAYYRGSLVGRISGVVAVYLRTGYDNPTICPVTQDTI